jgi:hypothetical protein
MVLQANAVVDLVVEVGNVYAKGNEWDGTGKRPDLVVKGCSGTAVLSDCQYTPQIGNDQDRKYDFKKTFTFCNVLEGSATLIFLDNDGSNSELINGGNDYDKILEANVVLSSLFDGQSQSYTATEGDGEDFSRMEYVATKYDSTAAPGCPDHPTPPPTPAPIPPARWDVVYKFAYTSMGIGSFCSIENPDGQKVFEFNTTDWGTHHWEYEWGPVNVLDSDTWRIRCSHGADQATFVLPVSTFRCRNHDECPHVWPESNGGGFKVLPCEEGSTTPFFTHENGDPFTCAEGKHYNKIWYSAELS